MLQRMRTPIVLLTLLISSVAMQSRALADTDAIRLKAGAVACDLPAGWLAVNREQSRDMYNILYADAEGMVNAYSAFHNSGQDVNGKHGVKEFNAAQIPGWMGYVRAYAFHLKPQEAYYTTAQGFNHNVTTGMQQQNAATKVHENGTVMVGDREFLKLDITYFDQRRVISMAYWNVTNPDLVSHIDVVLLPGAGDEARQTGEAVLASIQAHFVAPDNMAIGNFSMHVPRGWVELTHAQQSPDLADRIRSYGNAPADASPDDLKLYRYSDGSRINAWTISLNQRGDFLQTVYATQLAALENERADLKRGEVRRGLFGGMDVVRVFKEYNNGDRRTTYLTWKWFSPGDAYRRTSFLSAVEVNISAPVLGSKDTDVLDSISYTTPPRAAVVPLD